MVVVDVCDGGGSVVVAMRQWYQSEYSSWRLQDPLLPLLATFRLLACAHMLACLPAY